MSDRLPGEMSPTQKLKQQMNTLMAERGIRQAALDQFEKAESIAANAPSSMGLPKKAKEAVVLGDKFKDIADKLISINPSKHLN